MAHRRHIPERTNRLCAGHTLLELITVLGILALGFVIPLAAFVSGLRGTESRLDAQTWQAAAHWGQVQQAWTGERVIVSAEPGFLSVGPATGYSELALGRQTVGPTANIPRWRTASGAAVSFSGSFASPDGAGSLTFGEIGLASRVVIRLESGLTRRERR